MRGGSVFDLAIIFQKVACQNKLPLCERGRNTNYNGDDRRTIPGLRIRVLRWDIAITDS